ncbi:unnamed protein product, partial [Rotaria magnacalcarata]
MTNEPIQASNNAVQAFAKSFETKHTQDYASDTIKDDDLQKLVGRVTCGSKEMDFEYLQKNPDAKKFSWIMGDDGLSLFLKQSNIQALRSIGLEDRWIRKKLENGKLFRLGVFYRSDACIPTSWDEVFSLIDTYYPKSISIKIRQHADVLKRMNFDEIEARARSSYLRGSSYFEISMSAVNGFSADPRYMSEE